MDGSERTVSGPLTGAMYPGEVTNELKALQKTKQWATAPEFIRRMFYRAILAEVTKAYVLGYHRGELAGALRPEPHREENP